ncbi:MAG: cyclic nucleotide-binding domain-containing protein, partial [Gammaproteobacteria bacterium]
MHDRLLSLRARGGPLAVLSEQEIADLSTGAEEVRREAGEVLLREGEQGDEACLVLEGRLAATRKEADGSISVLNEIGPGEFVGEIELVVGGTRMADVRVLEDASLAVLSRTRFEALLQRSPETWQRVTRLVEGRLRRMQMSGHLHRLFGPFDPSEGDIPDALADAIEFMTLPSGDDLFLQGDRADDACIVMSGLLRVAVDQADGSEQVINTVRSGEIVGEMALLSGEPRSATVYAVRDSILARIPRQEFDRLIDIYPGAMKSLTRIIIARLERQSSVAAQRENLHTNIALVAADPSVRLDEVAARLAATMETFGATILLDADRVDQELNQPGICRVADSHSAYPRLAEWLHELTERHRYVLYRAEADWSAWTERCVRQADHVVIVADGAADPAPGA